MLTVAKMGGGKADYYKGLAAEDYYVGKSFSLEPEGYWIGKGAEREKLAGKTVAGETFKSLFDGFSPDGKEKWVSNAGRYNKEKSERNRMPGYDLTFSAPKSVSICWAIGTDETRAAIESAQAAAIARTVEQIEKLAIIRTGSGGRIKESAGVIAGVFQHATARQVNDRTLPDMQIHSHVCLINTGISARGTRAALQGLDFLNQTFAKEYGAIYRAELAKEVHAIGFEIEKTKDAFEIKGVSRELIEEFSKRERQINEKLGKGRDEASAKEKLQANHKTRMAKKEYDPKDVLNHWVWTAEEKHHFSRESVERLRGVVTEEKKREESQAAAKNEEQSRKVEKTRAETKAEKAAKAKKEEQKTASPAEIARVVGIAALDLAKAQNAFTRRELLQRSLHEAAARGIGSDGVKDQVDQYIKHQAVYLAANQRDVQWWEKGEMKGRTITEGLYTTASHKFAADKEEHRRREREERKAEDLRSKAKEWGASGYKVMGATWSKERAERLKSGAGIQSATISRYLADENAEKKEKEKQGKGEKPQSRLVHEIKYATGQISKKKRDYLNQELKREKEALERQQRAIDSKTVIIIDAFPGKENKTMREFIAIAQVKGAIVFYAHDVRLPDFDLKLQQAKREQQARIQTPEDKRRDQWSEAQEQRL